jgi:hypothetical protein
MGLLAEPVATLNETEALLLKKGRPDRGYVTSSPCHIQWSIIGTKSILYSGRGVNFEIGRLVFDS